jgi:RNA polymerase sigma factor (TIGR02999 family)
MTDVTEILNAIEQGDPSASEQLLPLVYDELRKLAAQKMAKEAPGQTLQPTALVHEAYLRLAEGEESGCWESQGHFFAAAAEAMRRILVENARRKQNIRRGGNLRRRELKEPALAVAEPSDDILALDEALRRLAERHAVKAELVELRYFAGLTIAQAARAIGISTTTAERYWSYAKAWLHRELTAGGADLPDP